MKLEINGKLIEVKFTIGAIKQLDNIYFMKQSGGKFGMGINQLYSYLQSYNPVALCNALIVVQDVAGVSEIESWLETQDIEKLCNDMVVELSKQPMTKATIKSLKKQMKKVEAQQKSTEA